MFLLLGGMIEVEWQKTVEYDGYMRNARLKSWITRLKAREVHHL